MNLYTRNHNVAVHSNCNDKTVVKVTLRYNEFCHIRNYRKEVYVTQYITKCL